MPKLRRQEPVLIHNKHPPIAAKGKVSHAALDVNLPQQDTTGRPDVNPVPAASVHITFHIGLDPIRNTVCCHGEDATVGQKWLAVVGGNVECISK